MASIREQIVSAVVALLDGAGKPTGLRVHRLRTLPIDQDQLPACVVYLVTEETTRKGGRWGPRYRHALRIRVECREEGNPPDAQLDPLAAWVVRTLVGNQTLGGLAQSVELVEAQWDAERSNKVYGGVGLDLVITYDTTAADPEAA